MNKGAMAIIALSGLLVIWYAAGHLYNRRRGGSLRCWLESGLDVFGGEREAEWIGSPASGARFTIRRANPPLRRLEITLLLANREIPLLWLLDHLRGKRDRIIIRGTLRSPRRGEVEVTSDAPTYPDSEAWTWEKRPPGLSVGYCGLKGRQMATTVQPWLDTYGPHLRRFHWRKQDPHITVKLGIAGLLDVNAETLFADLSNALHE